MISDYPTPTPRPVGDSGAKVQGCKLLIVPTVRGKCCSSNIIWIFTPVEFSVIQVGAKSRAITINMSPQGGVSGDSVVTNYLELVILQTGNEPNIDGQSLTFWRQT